ncbi:DeoR/GlpR family DNA-binding transcription regulator [Gephyromycinifex aptenodytis]|uniref:DeoR/GlpR family DNA-binding transcription regulator n=1 Tax=Gephyromycinifex aptenodytis TaxID=2716227 RepID=UPI0014456999|nr:DeoR/GlpR family DNA-binding transcription regulator [Gephyromycinifex aptenodytis]
MRLTERQRLIMGQLRSGDYVEVKDLASGLGVDVSTIRRDLQALGKHDLVDRLHGGVRLRQDEPAQPAAPRVEQGHLAVASTARRMVRSGDSLILGSGPICDQLVPLLFDLEDLSLITNDLRSAQALAHHRGFKVIVAPGELRDGSSAPTTSGSLTADFYQAQRADWVFLEVDGLHPYAGLTTTAPWRVSAQRAMLQAGKRRCVLALSQSFGRRCVGFIAEIDAADLIVTDEQLPDEELPAFRGKVVRSSLDPLDDWRR